MHAPMLWALLGCPEHACSQVLKHALDGAACTACIRNELGRCARSHVLGALDALSMRACMRQIVTEAASAGHNPDSFVLPQQRPYSTICAVHDTAIHRD